MDRVLKLDEPVSIKYCIDSWLRDEQIKQNCSKVKGRIKARYKLRKEPIALVNFGPSLKDTWEEIKKFKYVMTCSGSHKFCVEHGIIPTHHIDVDPREHKCVLIGTPQKNTEYLIASTCHPKLLEMLKGFNVKLWHIFDTSEDGFRLLPNNEWALTGGCSVGVRTITMARFLGFTDLHVFGMDGCIQDGVTHADHHPNSTKKPYTLDYDGKTYHTSPAMLAAAQNTWHELDMMKDVNIKFYGEGLVQHMSRNYKRNAPDKSTFIAFSKPELISASYTKLNSRLHEDNLAYGVGGGKHAETVIKLVKKLKDGSEFVSVLDYGCGKGYLGKKLPFPIYEYDPAITGKTDPPRPADLVVCTDVLEHIEPDKLNYVLDDIARCTKKAAYFAIYTQPSTKTLADGRNTHLIVKDATYWMRKLSKYFVVPAAGFRKNGPVIICLVGAKKEKHRLAGEMMESK